MMKKITLQNRILSGVLAFAILLSLLPVRTLGTEFVTENPVPASAPAAPRITREGEPIQSISLASYERIEIVAESAASNSLFQWQILHPEKSDVWINIYDATHSYLFVTLALVRNMLKPDQTTQLRCRIVAGEQMQYTEPVFVQYCPELVYSPPSTVTEPTAPVETVAETVPMETTEATMPAETEQPTIPAETVPETVPAETTEATVPAETEQPTVPAETVPETAPMETTEATMPAETEQPTVPAETVAETVPTETTEATVPAETEQPTVPAETVPETVPAETTEATVPAETEQPTVPAETVPETAPVETTEATMPAETEQPTVPTETVPETAPMETAEAIVPAETEQPTVPAEKEPEAASGKMKDVAAPEETVPVTEPEAGETDPAPGQSDAERLWEEWILPALFTEEMYLDLQPVKDVASDEETGGSEFVNVTIDYVRYDFARDSGGKLIPQPQNNGQHSPVYHGGYLLEEEGTVAFTSYRATLQSGTDLNTTVPVPTLVGYQSYLEEGTDVVTQVEIDRTNITEDVRITVKYKPAKVKYTVRYYFQNIYDDLYAENTGMKIESQGFTGAMPVEAHLNPSPDTVDTMYPGKQPEELAQLKEMLRGFTSLYYQPDFIAADGSTVFEVYLERNYYLMEFDCNGGYGTDTLYNRYGSYISVPNPMLSGWQFNGWDLISTEASGQKVDTENGTVDTLPTEMPPYNTAYKAVWGTANTTYTVAYWIQNEDGSKSYIGSHIANAESGSYVSGQDYLHRHDDTCYSCGHMHTIECGPRTWNSRVDEPGEWKMPAMQALGEGEPESGFAYCVDRPGDGKDYYLKFGDKWYGWSRYDYETDNVQGDLLKSATITYNGSEYTAYKYQIKAFSCNKNHTSDCQMICGKHEYIFADDFDVDIDHLEYIEEKTDKDVLVHGDGSTVVNVYYQYKTYRLKFYYAAANGDTRTSSNVAYRIVGGCSYFFGGQHQVGTYGNYLNSSTFDMLDRMFDNGVGHVGNVASGKVPSLKENIENANIYDIGCDYHQASDRTYYYIAFTARYNDVIVDRWPADVFAPVEMATGSSTTNGSWTSNMATVSAWNGEHHVWYSRRVDNETIKGKYEKLDYKIVYDSDYYVTYPVSNDSSGENPLPTISYLCFWENGAQANWNIPELYRYNFYLEALPGQDLENKITINKTRVNAQNETEIVTYYLDESFDTCDDSSVAKQTQPALAGFESVKYKAGSTVEKNASGEYVSVSPEPFSYDDFEYKRLIKGADYSADQYNEGYSVNFYYDRINYKINFKNHGADLMDGGGAIVPYGKNLGVYGEYVSVEKMNNGWEDPDTGVWFDPYPPTLEPNAYEFTGWYTSEEFVGDTRIDDWGSMTMPDSDMVVYARWEPVKRNVTFYTLYEDIGKRPGDEGYDEKLMPFLEAENVPHGSTLGSAYNKNPAEALLEDGTLKDKRIEGYTFIGWFYMDEDNKKRFAPDTMEINRDLVLFAEWKTSIDTTYEVHYVLGADAYAENTADGRQYPKGTPVADSIFAHASVGKTKTFTAKGKQELYSPFQSKFFPTVNSHSILMTEEPEDNTFTFEYVYDDCVFYKIRYLEAGTNKQLHPDVEKNTQEDGASVVTVKFLPIPGYLPQSYYIRKTLAYDGPATEAIEENIITFYYVRDTAHGIYSVEYYLENVDGSYTQYETIVGTDDLKDEQNNPKVFTAEVRQYEGYEPRPDRFEVITYDEAGNVAQTLTGTAAGNPPKGTISANGLTIKLYYSRKSYPYTVEYWLAGSDIEDPAHTGQLAVPVLNGSAKFDSQVSWSLTAGSRDDRTLKIGGNTYEFAPSDPANGEEEQTKSITIRTGNGENRIIFYFLQKEVEIFYHVVCTDPALQDICGAVSLYSEKASTLSGAKAIPKSGFVFRGWYMDEACTADQKVPDNWLKQGDPDHLIPQERKQNTDDDDPNNDWINRYYALFEPVRKPLTITKEGQNLSADDSFLFRITGVGTDAIGQTIDLTVAIQGSGSVTIPDLYCGTYQVMELTNWSWAYENTDGAERTVTITTAEDTDPYTVIFTNEAKTEEAYLWLHGEASVDNRFDAVTEP